jgi:hypothetical protein
MFLKLIIPTPFEVDGIHKNQLRQWINFTCKEELKMPLIRSACWCMYQEDSSDQLLSLSRQDEGNSWCPFWDMDRDVHVHVLGYRMLVLTTTVWTPPQK